MINEILEKIRYYSIYKSNTIACRFSNDNVTYGKLENDTNIIARKIKFIIGNKRQLPIIIYYKRSIQFIEIILAILKCQCFYVPLERSMPIERVKYIYNDIDAALIITDLEDCFDSSYNVSTLENLKYVSDSPELEFLINENDLIYVMYTSGTSGYPKGVKIMYSNLINLINSFWDIVYKKFTMTVSVGVLASFSFDASVKQIFCALYYGHTLCVADDSDKILSRKLHEFHLKYNLAICDATPSHIRFMIMQKIKSVSRIPYIVVGGETLHWELLHKYYLFAGHFETVFINVYGPTECCVDVAYKVITRRELNSNFSGIVPIGKSIKNTMLTLHTEDDNVIEKCNMEGELCVEGKQVGAGYVSIASSSFVKKENGVLYKTGDIAYMNFDKEFVVIGRKDSQVKVNGYRIELNEIQTIIGKYLNVDCITFCITNGKTNEKKIVAYICKEEFSDSDREELVAYLKGMLPAYMIPHYFMGGRLIPLTKNGKTDEGKLRKIFLDNIKDNQ